MVGEELLFAAIEKGTRWGLPAKTLENESKIGEKFGCFAAS